MSIKLIVGLGNPGKAYADTRHNTGFWLVERLAAAHRAAFRKEARFQGLTAKLATPGGETWLLLPQTFMNESGRSVGALARFYKILPEEILVVHDELDFEPGVAKLKRGGGVSGHNGLKDILGHLGRPDFWRLRIGIGHPGDRDVVADYVLHPPRREEQPLIEEAIARGLDACPLILDGKLQAAMLKLHTKPAGE